MRRIREQVYSHLSLRQPHSQRTYVKDVRLDSGLIIDKYPDLVKAVASLSYNNPVYNLYFRGQTREYQQQLKKGQVCTCYPSIFRGVVTSIATKNPRRRLFQILNESCNELLENWQFGDPGRLRKYDELKWALIQHYQVFRTPLLDLTQSVRVAASFALLGNSDDYGYVYVFGFPNINGSISYYVEDELVLVKLQSAAPPQALRTHFQEGYMVGHFPYDQERHVNKDVARRMIAKFRVRNGKWFWSKNYPAIPQRALFPPNDNVETFVNELKQADQAELWLCRHVQSLIPPGLAIIRGTFRSIELGVGGFC